VKTVPEYLGVDGAVIAESAVHVSRREPDVFAEQPAIESKPRATTERYCVLIVKQDECADAMWQCRIVSRAHGISIARRPA
jgi:hypothetical protein